MRARILKVAAAAALATAGLVAAVPGGTAVAETGDPTVFAFVGSGVEQEYVVPAGVTQLQVQVEGAAGGMGGTCDIGGGNTCGSPSAGGAGARVVATIDVQPGDVVTIRVGGKGADGGSSGVFGSTIGGDGGGASVIVVNGVPALVAGAGGGGGGGGDEDGTPNITGGAGGASSSAGGVATEGTCNGGAGGAGTQTAGGDGGAGGDSHGAADGHDGVAGALGQGGDGGAGGADTSLTGGAGGGGGGGLYGGGGGGGGGGNGNGCTGPGGGGGGGSSLAADGTVTEGVVTGDGSVTITPIYALQPNFTG